MYFPSDSWGKFLKEFNQDAVFKEVYDGELSDFEDDLSNIFVDILLGKPKENKSAVERMKNVLEV